MITTASELQEVLEVLRNDGVAAWTPNVLQEHSDSLAETMCALANMPDGGAILFGLDESRGVTAVGVSNAQTLERRIHVLAQQHIAPTPRVHCYRATTEGKLIVVVNVHGLPFEQRPCRVKTTNKAYMRGTEGNYVLSQREIAWLQSCRDHKGHDQTPVDGSSREHLDPDRTSAFLRLAREHSSLLRQGAEDQVLRMKGVIEPAGNRLTLAGLYVLGRYPQQFFPNLTLTTQFRSSETPEQNTEVQRFEGPLPELLENGVRWVLRMARTAGEGHADGSGFRGTKIPIIAIREVIANALIHRDLSQYSVGRSVDVRFDGDVLSVSNPGGLWSISSDQLGNGSEQTAVNDALYEICRLTPVSGGHLLVDPTRSTLGRVHTAMRRVAMHIPTYTDFGTSFMVRLGRRIDFTEADQQWLRSLPQHETLSTIQRYVLVGLSREGRWDLNQIHQELSSNENETLKGQLLELTARGIIVRSDGSSPSYRLDKAWAREESHGSSTPHDFVYSPGIAAPETSIQADTSTVASGRELPAAEDRARQAAESSKHGATLWNVLQDGPKDIHALVEGSDLSLSQVRYAMQRLVTDGLVHRSGGQGHRQTLYMQTQ